jgi:ankyrin repeat protein
MSEPIDPEVLAFARQLFDLARSGDTARLGAYLDAGLPINLTNDKGDTLLMLATYHNHPQAVRALIARGADVTRVNDRGQTALAAAVFRQSPDSVTALLAAGADPFDGSPSAVEMANFFELPEMLKLLQERDS